MERMGRGGHEGRLGSATSVVPPCAQACMHAPHQSPPPATPPHLERGNVLVALGAVHKHSQARGTLWQLWLGGKEGGGGERVGWHGMHARCPPAAPAQHSTPPPHTLARPSSPHLPTPHKHPPARPPTAAPMRPPPAAAQPPPQAGGRLPGPQRGQAHARPPGRGVVVGGGRRGGKGKVSTTLPTFAPGAQQQQQQQRASSASPPAAASARACPPHHWQGGAGT